MGELFFVGVFGLIIGSFLGALTYRMPRGISISAGRSFCPSCKHQIAWYDNIPLLSYIFLAGRCRNCKKPISLRYPLIESITAGVLMWLFIAGQQINSVLPLPVVLFIATILLAIFVIDCEHQIIPDECTFLGILITLVVFIAQDYQGLYLHLFAGLVASCALLLVHIMTRGRGMGLGDVKFAILGGMIVGFPLVVVWLAVSFLLGGIVGALLLTIRHAKLKDRIAFGPFLVIGLLVTLVFGKIIYGLIFWI